MDIDKMTGETLALLANQYCGEDHEDLWQRVDILLKELEGWRKRCPMCFEQSLKETICPETGQESFCESCGWTSMDLSPKTQIEDLRTELAERREDTLREVKNHIESEFSPFSLSATVVYWLGNEIMKETQK